LWEGDRPLLGVIHDFNLDEMFSGIVGRSAFLNGESMRVSNITNISQASLATGFPVARDFSEESLRRFLTQIQAFKKQRLIGTAALAMAYAACGRVDAYFEE